LALHLVSPRHLLCNLTNVPTYVVLFAAPGAVAGGLSVFVESDMYAGQIAKEHPDWVRQLAKVRFWLWAVSYYLLD
jgi:hypothetical protein